MWQEKYICTHWEQTQVPINILENFPYFANPWLNSNQVKTRRNKYILAYLSSVNPLNTEHINLFWFSILKSENWTIEVTNRSTECQSWFVLRESEMEIITSASFENFTTDRTEAHLIQWCKDCWFARSRGIGHLNLALRFRFRQTIASPIRITTY